ncbi:hypothetical protein DW657_13345 [Prevotella sp. AM23-5]|nr:hypothetical protein DW657_13345 [Prevotella sp. AM23-5]
MIVADFRVTLICGAKIQKDSEYSVKQTIKDGCLSFKNHLALIKTESFRLNDHLFGNKISKNTLYFPFFRILLYLCTHKKQRIT